MIRLLCTPRSPQLTCSTGLDLATGLSLSLHVYISILHHKHICSVHISISYKEVYQRLDTMEFITIPSAYLLVGLELGYRCVALTL